MRRAIAVIGIVSLISIGFMTSTGAASPHKWLLRHHPQLSQLTTALTEATGAVHKAVKHPTLKNADRAAAACTVLGTVNQEAMKWNPPSAAAKSALNKMTTDIESFANACIQATTPQNASTVKVDLAQLATDLGTLQPDFQAFLGTLG